MHFLCIEDKHESNIKNKNKGRICWPIQQYAICTFQIPVCMLDKTNYIYDLGTGASIQEDIHMWELPFNQHRKLLSVSQSVRGWKKYFFFFLSHCCLFVQMHIRPILICLLTLQNPIPFAHCITSVTRNFGSI